MSFAPMTNPALTTLHRCKNYFRVIILGEPVDINSQNIKIREFLTPPKFIHWHIHSSALSTTRFIGISIHRHYGPLDDGTSATSSIRSAEAAAEIKTIFWYTMFRLCKETKMLNQCLCRKRSIRWRHRKLQIACYIENTMVGCAIPPTLSTEFQGGLIRPINEKQNDPKTCFLQILLYQQLCFRMSVIHKHGLQEIIY